MELWDVFEKRRTIRKFSAPPSAQQLKRLLKAGSIKRRKMRSNSNGWVKYGWQRQINKN